MVCDWWISIRFVCFCVSRFVACDCNYDWRQRKMQLRRRLLNFCMFVKSAVKKYLNKINRYIQKAIPWQIHQNNHHFNIMKGCNNDHHKYKQYYFFHSPSSFFSFSSGKNQSLCQHLHRCPFPHLDLLSRLSCCHWIHPNDKMFMS